MEIFKGTGLGLIDHFEPLSKWRDWTLKGRFELSRAVAQGLVRGELTPAEGAEIITASCDNDQRLAEDWLNS